MVPSTSHSIAAPQPPGTTGLHSVAAPPNPPKPPPKLPPKPPTPAPPKPPPVLALEVVVPGPVPPVLLVVPEDEDVGEPELVDVVLAVVDDVVATEDVEEDDACVEVVVPVPPKPVPELELDPQP